MNQNFKKKIRSLMMLSYIIVLVIMIAETYISQRQNLKHSLTDQLNISLHNFDKQISLESEMLSKTLIGLERLDNLLELHSQKNKEELYKQAKPIFDNLKAEKITHWYFFDNNGVNLLRVHKPEQFGDKPNRVSLIESMTNNKISIKLEMGKNFFSLRAVKPIYLKSQHVGYMEIGQEIDHLFNRFLDMTGQNVSVFLDQQYLEKVKANLKGEKIQNFTLLNSSQADIALKLAQSIEMAKSLNEVQIAFVDNYAVALKPFKDGAGNIAGVIMIHMDTSMLKNHMNQQALISIAMYSITLILGFLFFSRIMSSILNNLGGDPKYAIQVTKQIASGDLSVKIQHDRNDSDSILASISLMNEKLNQMIQQIGTNSHKLANQASQLEKIAQDAENSSSQQQSSVGSISTYLEDILEKINDVNHISNRATELTEQLKPFKSLTSKSGYCSQIKFL